MACTPQYTEQEINDILKSMGGDTPRNRTIFAQSLDKAKKAATLREANKNRRQDEALLPKTEHTLSTIDDGISDAFTASVSKLNSITGQLLTNAIDTTGRSILESQTIADADAWAKDHVPLYENTVDVLSRQWKSNATIAHIRNYVLPERSGLLPQMNDLASVANTAKQNMITRMDVTTKKLSVELAKHLKTPEEIEVADNVFAKSGAFAIVRNGMLNRIAKGESIDSLIDELVDNNKGVISKDQHIAKVMAKYYMNKDIRSDSGVAETVHTNLTGYPGMERGTDRYHNVEALIALEALKLEPRATEIIGKLYKTQSYTDLTSLALSVNDMHTQMMNMNHESGVPDVDITRGNMVDDVGRKDYTIVAINHEDLSSSKYSSSNGWKVLQKPTKDGKVGLVYRETTSGLQDGYGLNTSYLKAGITIPPHIAKSKKFKKANEDGIAYRPSADGSYKVPTVTLTDEHRKVLGIYNDPIKSLMRAYAHKELILETQEVRSTFLSTFTKAYDSTEDAEKDLTKRIAEGDHPVFVKLTGDTTLDDLSQDITDLYEVVDKSVLSDVGDFKNQIALVRKDLNQQVVGYREGDVFSNYTANKWHKNVRNVIRQAKIGMIVVNAPKIALDLTSGIALAAAKGSSIQEIYKYTLEVTTGTKRLGKARNAVLKAKYDLSVVKTDEKSSATRIKKYEARLAAAEKALKEDPLSAALANGFIQSLSTEMFTHDRESIQGLQVDFEDLLSKMTKDEKGEFTKLNDYIHKAANFGGPNFGVETLMAKLADGLESFDGTKTYGEVMREMSKDIANIKSRKDMTAYVAEIAMSPGSHMVKVMSSATLYADLIPRWILYKHNINAGMSEQDAVKDALVSLLDYKQNMPKSLKFLSDLYILPYPSFFTRIQRVIYTMATRTPVSFTAQEISNEVLGYHGQNIIGSSILRKYGDDSWYSSPLDAVNLGNLFPYANFLG